MGNSPAFGYLADNSPIVNAIGNTTRTIRPHAINDAGPDISATNPGIISMPEPNTAPMYNAVTCDNLSVGLNF